MSTIGPFTNVPEPGAPIASAWAQQLTQYAVDLVQGLGSSGLQAGTVPTGPHALTTTPIVIGSLTIPNLPLRAIVIARVSAYISSQSGSASYVNIGLRIGGGSTRYWRGLGSDIPSSWHIDAQAVLGANAGDTAVEVYASAQAATSITLGGTSDYNAILASYICVGEQPVMTLLPADDETEVEP